jgi:lactoylglutathione lyase
MRVPPQVPYAKKGDLALSPGDGQGFISLVVASLGPPQVYDHMGIFVDNGLTIRHCTSSKERVKQKELFTSEITVKLAGVITLDRQKIPLNGFRPDLVKFGWPGSISQTVEEVYRTGRNSLNSRWSYPAMHPGADSSDPEDAGKPFRLYQLPRSERGRRVEFNDPELDRSEALVRLQDTSVFLGDPPTEFLPLLVRPHPQFEPQARSALELVAEMAKRIDAHYRYFAYTRGDIGIDPNFNAPPAGDPSWPTPGATWAADTIGAMCSSFVWTSVQHANEDLAAQGRPVILLEDKADPPDPATGLCGGRRMTDAPTSGLFEAHLTVEDLDRSVTFYRDVVGLEPAFEMPDQSAAFLWAGGHGSSMLGLWVEHSPLTLSLHVAFRTSVEDVLGACERLRSAGVTPLSFFTTETDEPSVIGWMPAAAVYFRDPDGHLLEYLTMLDARPRPELGIVSWSKWKSTAADRHTVQWYSGPRSRLRGLFDLADDSPERIDSYIDLGRVLTAVDDGGQLVGHLQLVPDARPGVVEITSLAVDPNSRRRGVGSRLADHALSACRADGAEVVTVATAMADVDNLRFYQRRGFRAVSIVPDAFTPETGYAGVQEVAGIPLRDAVRFELALNGT